MAKRKVEDIVLELAQPIVDNFNFELVDIEYVKEGQDWFLRVYIDKEGGVDLNDCQAVSERLSDLLDEVDPITNSYYLEVSSPGLDRPLKKDKDYERYIDRDIEVKLYTPFEGNKYYKGVNKGLKDDNLQLLVEDELLEIPRKQIASVRLYFEF